MKDIVAVCSLLQVQVLHQVTRRCKMRDIVAEVIGSVLFFLLILGFIFAIFIMEV